MFVLRAALEKKMAGRQGREDLIKKGLLEMMEQGKWGWARLGPGTQSWGSHGGPANPSGWSVPGPLSGCGSCTGLSKIIQRPSPLLPWTPGELGTPGYILLALSKVPSSKLGLQNPGPVLKF